MPKTYGQRRHPCFFLTCCSRKNEKSMKSDQVKDKNNERDFETRYLSKDSYEDVPRETAIKEEEGKILKISDLKKTYDNGFQAVNGVNLKIY